MSTPTFKLEMNLMVQNLLLSSLGMCKFVMMHKEHPLTSAIEQFKLIEPSQLDTFIETVKSTKTGQTIMLSMADEILIYTALDITCKAYLTELGDEMEKLNAARMKEGGSTFSDIRSTILKGCEIVMEGMKENFSGNSDFDDRTDVLENYIFV